MSKSKLIKILAPIMAVAVALTVVLFAVTGNNTPVDTEFTFSLVDGNAVLTGSPDALSGAVVLPDTVSGYKVTGIGDDAFKDCDDVTAFFIPESVTNIGDFAFEGCSALVNATLPNGITKIGEGAFSGCSSLVSMTIPADVTDIGTCAFMGCTSLESLIILGTNTPVLGIFNAALDIGQVVAIGSPYQNIIAPVDTVVYCYNASEAYYDLIADGGVCAYSLLDNQTLTDYTVNYVDENGNALYDAKTVTLQPVGIKVKEVAAPVEGYEYPSEIASKTLEQNGNIITFVYEEEIVTTTEESTTEEVTTEAETTEEETTEEETTEAETTEEETTEAETTEEETTEEETTEEETTEEETTEEETTEEPTTEPVFVKPELVALSDATVNNTNGLVYGLDTELTEDVLMKEYLKVTGDGYVRVSNANIGTGTVITLYSSKDDSVVAVYTVIIFGDLNSDGLITSTDISALKSFINGSSSEGDNPNAYLASDMNNDGEVTSTDLIYVKSVLSGASEYDQADRILV